MTIQDTIDKLKGGYYVDAAWPANPGGFRSNGHRVNFPAALAEVAEVAEYAGEQASNVEAALQAGSVISTSASSVAIGAGAKSFVTATGLSFYPGMYVKIGSVSDAANYMAGFVTSYTTGTGALVVDVDQTGGAGTHADWAIFPFGPIASQAQAEAGTDNSRMLSPLRGAQLFARKHRLPPETWTAAAALDTAGADNAKIVTIDGASAITLPPATAGGAGYFNVLRHRGDTVIEVLTDSAELIGGLTSLELHPGEAVLTIGNGTGYDVIALGEHRVGDVVLAPAPPSSAWLECDGSIYAQTAYPALFGELGLVPDAALDAWDSLTAVHPGSTTMRGGVYDETHSAWVLGGAGGVVWLSFNAGASWSAGTAGTANTGHKDYWDAASNGAGTVVLVGEADGAGTGRYTLDFSTDGGVTLAAAAGATAQVSLFGVTYGAGLFVAVGAGGRIETSANGATWTQRTSPDSNELRCVGWNGSVFVVGGGNGALHTSPDGIAWTARTLGYSNQVNAVAYGNGRWLAADSNNRVLESLDQGVTWSLIFTNSNTFNDVAFAGGYFWACEGNGVVKRSIYGREWETATTTLSNSLNAIELGVAGGQLLVMGGTGDLASRDLYSYAVASQFAAPRTAPPAGLKHYLRATP